MQQYTMPSSEAYLECNTRPHHLLRQAGISLHARPYVIMSNCIGTDAMYLLFGEWSINLLEC